MQNWKPNLIDELVTKHTSTAIELYWVFNIDNKIGGKRMQGSFWYHKNITTHVITQIILVTCSYASVRRGTNYKSCVLSVWWYHGLCDDVISVSPSNWNLPFPIQPQYSYLGIVVVCHGKTWGVSIMGVPLLWKTHLPMLMAPSLVAFLVLTTTENHLDHLGL